MTFTAHTRTHTNTCPVCVLVAAGVSTVYCPVSPISLRLFKAKDGTCRAIEKETEEKKKIKEKNKEGHNTSGKAGQDWLIAGVLCCQCD